MPSGDYTSFNFTGVQEIFLANGANVVLSPANLAELEPSWEIGTAAPGGSSSGSATVTISGIEDGRAGTTATDLYGFIYQSVGLHATVTDSGHAELFQGAGPDFNNGTFTVQTLEAGAGTDVTVGLYARGAPALTTLIADANAKLDIHGLSGMTLSSISLAPGATITVLDAQLFPHNGPVTQTGTGTLVIDILDNGLAAVQGQLVQTLPLPTHAGTDVLAFVSIDHVGDGTTGFADTITGFTATDRIDLSALTSAVSAANHLAAGAVPVVSTGVSGSSGTATTVKAGSILTALRMS
jgi:hypothetical protein